MPPRPPVTTLMIHTWKEHGKPRPLSSQEQSAQSARARISKSLSYDAHLSLRKVLDDEIPLSTEPHCRPVVIRSTSVEEGLLASRCSPVAVSPVSNSQSDESDSFGVLPELPRCIAVAVEERSDVGAMRGDDASRGTPQFPLPERVHEGLPPLPKEWPLCHRGHVARGRDAPPAALTSLLTGHLPKGGKARRQRARSLGTGLTFENSLLGESLITGSSSFDAGLSDVAHRGIVQSGVSPNV